MADDRAGWRKIKIGAVRGGVKFLEGGKFSSVKTSQVFHSGVATGWQDYGEGKFTAQNHELHLRPRDGDTLQFKFEAGSWWEEDKQPKPPEEARHQQTTNK